MITLVAHDRSIQPPTHSGVHDDEWVVGLSAFLQIIPEYSV